MIINPSKYALNGWIKAHEACPSLNLKEQVQQAGFDLRVNIIYDIVGTGSLLANNKKKLPNYGQRPFSLYESYQDCWFLEKGVYSVDCMEDVALPIGKEAKVIHRSTLNRSGLLFTGSVYDPGFEGLIGGTLYVSNSFWLQRGSRIGQIQIQDCEEGELYNGDYQKTFSHVTAKEALK